jgi:hypothetical protein
MPQLGLLAIAYWQLGVLALLAYVARLYGQYYRLRHFQGPRTTGFSVWWMILAVKGKKTHLAYAGVNEKYGECCFDLFSPTQHTCLLHRCLCRHRHNAV